MAALDACEVLTDEHNWRGGVRVTLSNGQAVAAARKAAKQKPKAKQKASAARVTEGEQDPAPEQLGLAATSDKPTPERTQATSERTADAAPARQRGTVDLVKGPFGLVASEKGSGRALTREENVCFASSKSLAGSAPLPAEAACVTAPRPRPEEAVDPGARPESFKSRLVGKAYRMARGPDGTLGFAEGCRVGLGRFGAGLGAGGR